MRASLFLISLCLFSQVSWGKLRVCYYTNWSQYRPSPMTFWPENVDASLCTHIVYAFSDMQGNDLWPFEVNDHELFARLQTVKSEYPDLKTLLGVGGWTFNLAKMTSMLSTEANRADFIQNCISYLRQHDFDGLDLDFEYPGSRGSIPEDKFLFTKLVQEMRVEFDLEGQQTGRETLLMSAAVACGKENIDRGYEIDLISVELDWIGLMSYDLSGAWDNITGFNSPLRSNDPATDVSYHTKSVDWCATYWYQGGAPKEKLIPGIAAHGRGFTLKDPNNNGVNALATGGPPLWGSNPGQFTQQEGLFSYFEVCQTFLNLGSTVERPPIYETPYTYLGDQWTGYDDVESVTLKAQYVCDNNYAGYLVWTLDLDDFNNNFCSEGNNPLHTAAMDVILTCPSGPSSSTSTAPTPPPTTPTTTTTTVTTPTPTPAPTTTTSTPASGTTTSPLPSGCENNFCAGKPDGVYAHENCRMYIVCYADVCDVETCNLGSYYNPYEKLCDAPQNLPDDIQERCGLTRELLQDERCRGRSIGKHAVPGTCASYIECLSDGVRHIFRQCGHGRCFDSEKKRCDWCSNVTCQ